jgi:hypothetical protein
MDGGPQQSHPDQHQQSQHQQQLVLNQLLVRVAQQQKKQQHQNQEITPSLNYLLQQQEQQQPRLNNVLLVALQNQLQTQQQHQAQRAPQQPFQARTSRQGHGGDHNPQQLQLQQLQMLLQLAQHQKQAALLQQQKHQSFGQEQDAVNRKNNTSLFDHQAASGPEVFASGPSPAKVARTTRAGASSTPSSGALGSRGRDGGAHYVMKDNDPPTTDACTDTPPEDSEYNPIPSLHHPVQGTVLVPCRARGGPEDHNFKVCMIHNTTCVKQVSSASLPQIRDSHFPFLPCSFIYFTVGPFCNSRKHVSWRRTVLLSSNLPQWRGQVPLLHRVSSARGQAQLSQTPHA